MLHAAQRSTLDYICGRRCIKPFVLNRADIWVLHVFLDKCRKHGKNCIFAETERAVRLLQTGEARSSTGEAVPLVTTRKRVRAVVREISHHNVRTHFSTVAEQSKMELSTSLFRSSGCPASPLAPVFRRCRRRRSGPVCRRRRRGRVPRPPAACPHGGGGMVDPRRHGRRAPSDWRRVQPTQGAGPRAGVRVHPDGSCDVAYLKGLGRRTELNIAAKYIGPKPADAERSKDVERLRQAVVASRRKVNMLMKQVHVGRAAAQQHAKEITSTRSELARSKADFGSLLRAGGRGGRSPARAAQLRPRCGRRAAGTRSGTPSGSNGSSRTSS